MSQSDQTPVAPSALTREAPEIPLSFAQSTRCWFAVNEDACIEAEQRILRQTIPYYRLPSEQDIEGQPNARILQVNLPQTTYKLNTLQLLPASYDTERLDSPAIVLLHGFGAGLGSWITLYPFLADYVLSSSIPVYAFDWLGMGRSSRFQHTIKTSKTDSNARITEAESFFLESFESWRTQMGIGKMIIVGHSLGGYLALAYALKWAKRVIKIVLLSPAGIHAPPPVLKDGPITPSRLGSESPNPVRDSPLITAEDTVDISSILSFGSDSTISVVSEEAVQPKSPRKLKKKRKEKNEKETHPESEKPKVDFARVLFEVLWKETFNPFGLLRGLSFWAPLLVGKYMTSHFPSLSETNLRSLNHYLLNIALLPASWSEHSYAYFLNPGGSGRLPMVNRIHELSKDIPVIFVYGERDWMDPYAGTKCVQIMSDGGNDEGKVVLVMDAAHQVHLDNPRQVSEILKQELDTALQMLQL